MKKINFINLIALNVIIIFINGSNNSKKIAYCNSECILGKYISDNNLQNIITEYIGFELINMKMVDLKSHIRMANLRQDKVIVCVCRTETNSDQYYNEEHHIKYGPYRTLKVIDLEKLKCKKIIDYSSIYDTYSIAYLIAWLINGGYKRACIRLRQVGDIKISSDGQMVSVRSTFRELFLPETKIFDTNSNKCLKTIIHDDNDSYKRHEDITKKEFGEPLIDRDQSDKLAYSNNLKYLAVYKPGLIKISDINSKENIKTLKIDNDKNHNDGALFFSHDDKYLILVQGNFIYRWLNQSVGIISQEIQEVKESNSIAHTDFL